MSIRASVSAISAGVVLRPPPRARGPRAARTRPRSSGSRRWRPGATPGRRSSAGTGRTRRCPGRARTGGRGAGRRSASAAWRTTNTGRSPNRRRSVRGAIRAARGVVPPVEGGEQEVVGAGVVQVVRLERLELQHHAGADRVRAGRPPRCRRCRRRSRRSRSRRAGAGRSGAPGGTRPQFGADPERLDGAHVDLAQVDAERGCSDPGSYVLVITGDPFRGSVAQPGLDHAATSAAMAGASR